MVFHADFYENYVSYFVYVSDLKTIYSYFITIILIINHLSPEKRELLMMSYIRNAKLLLMMTTILDQHHHI